MLQDRYCEYLQLYVFLLFFYWVKVLEVYFSCFAIKIAVQQCSAHESISNHAAEQLLPACFFQIWGMETPQSVWPLKAISQVPRAPGYLLLWSQKADERTEGALHVTNMEFDLHTNVYNWNNASIIMVISRCFSRCFSMVDLWKALCYRSDFRSEKLVTLSLIYSKLPCSEYC